MKNSILYKHGILRYIITPLILILFCFMLVYLLLSEFSQSPPRPPYLEEKTFKKQLNWQEYLPYLKNLVLEKFKELPANLNVSLEKIIDIDGDGINEALVNLNYGGAATEDYIWVKQKDNNIEIVKFKEKDGSIKEKIFIQGVGGGGRYGFNFDFLENERIIFQASFYAYNSSEDFCKVEAYAYNNLTNLFEYNEEKSKILTEKYCKNLCNSLNPELQEYFVNICK